MEKPVDIVYVLGTGSKWNNNEIRFSLRSIERNLLDYGNVFIVGECPDFLQNVIHIPANDIFEPGLNADGNIITKVLAACNDERLSDNFLFINDDHLVLHPIAAADVPPLHKGDMTTFHPSYWELNFWRKRLLRTKNVLFENGLSTLHFDCHTPIVFNKHLFRDVVTRFEYQEDIGYTMKSLYGNVIYPDGPFLNDQKRTIFRHYQLAEIDERLEDPTFVSFNDDGLNTSLKWWLIDKFRSKSRYEKNQAEDYVFDLFFWKMKGMPYAEGVELFCKHFKNRHANLQQLFKTGYSESLEKKLRFKLNMYLSNL